MACKINAVIITSDDEEEQCWDIQQSEDLVHQGAGSPVTRFLHMPRITKEEHPWYKAQLDEVEERIGAAQSQFRLWQNRERRLRREMEGMGFVSALRLKNLNEAERNKSYWHWRLVMAGSRKNLLAAGFKRYLMRMEKGRIEREPHIQLDEEGQPIVPPEEGVYTTDEDIPEEGDIFDPKKHGEY